MSGRPDLKPVARFLLLSNKPETGIGRRFPGGLNFLAKPDNILDLLQPFS